MEISEIQFPLVAKKPTSLLVAPALAMVMSAVVLAVIAPSALGGGLQGVDQKTLIGVYAFSVIAVLVFLGGLAWMLTTARFQLTFPDEDHLVLRTLKRTTSCRILDIDATTVGASGNTLLVFKDEAGKSLGYLESTARNWSECVTVIKAAHLRAEKREWYQQMVETTWYCPLCDGAVCIDYVDEDDMVVFAASDPDLASNLAEDSDSAKAFTIEELVKTVDESADSWAIVLYPNNGEKRRILDAECWVEAREMLGL